MKFSRTLMAATALLASSAAMGQYWGGDRYNGYGDYNDWPVWTPMYWMEEFFDNGFGNNDDYGYGGYGYNPYGYGAPYGYAPFSGYAPYGTPPGYGYGYAPPTAPAAPQVQ